GPTSVRADAAPVPRSRVRRVWPGRRRRRGRPPRRPLRLKRGCHASPWEFASARFGEFGRGFGRAWWGLPGGIGPSCALRGMGGGGRGRRCVPVAGRRGGSFGSGGSVL